MRMFSSFYLDIYIYQFGGVQMKKKKFAGVLLTVALLASPALPQQGLAAGKGFTDIDNSFAKGAILELAEKGILEGLPSGQFNPTGGLPNKILQLS